MGRAATPFAACRQGRRRGRCGAAVSASPPRWPVAGLKDAGRRAIPPERKMHEQNMAILKSLVSVAWADGVFANEEKEMVEALIAAFEATDDEAKQIRDYAAVKRTLEDIPVTELS